MQNTDIFNSKTVDCVRITVSIIYPVIDRWRCLQLSIYKTHLPPNETTTNHFSTSRTLLFAKKNIVVICSTSCMGGGVSDNFLGIAASLSRFTSINKQHLKIAFCWCISRVLTARRDFTAGASAGVLSGQTTQAESRTIDIALYVQCVISLLLISLSLNVSLSPKLGLRPKISQKLAKSEVVFSFGLSDSLSVSLRPNFVLSDR